MKQKELAGYLGLSKGEISKRVARGMPTSSFEAAQAWANENIVPRHKASPGDMPLVEIARALGVGKPAITKARADGMPVDSVDAARRWFALNRRRTRLHRLNPTTGQPNLPGL